MVFLHCGLLSCFEEGSNAIEDTVLTWSFEDTLNPKPGKVWDFLFPLQMVFHDQLLDEGRSNDISRTIIYVSYTQILLAKRGQKNEGENIHKSSYPDSPQ